MACQAHPALVKIGIVLARLFHFNSLRPGAMAVLRRPCPAGTKQYDVILVSSTKSDPQYLQAGQGGGVMIYFENLGPNFPTLPPGNKGLALQKSIEAKITPAKPGVSEAGQASPLKSQTSMHLLSRK